MPQFGRGEATPVAFDVTPYAPALPPTLTPSTEQAASAAPVTAGDAVGDATDEAAVAAADPLTDPTATNPETGRRQYNGEVVAKERTTIVAQTNGLALTVNVEVGDEVNAGDVLVDVESATQEAQSAQALAGLMAAQSQLELLQEGASTEDLEAARAAVSAAAAAYERALQGATDEDKRMVLAQVRQAEAAVTVAQAGYNQVKGNPMIGALPQSLALQQATLQLEAAQAQYDKVLKGTTNDIIAGAYAQLAAARAQLKRLEEGAKAAQIRAAEAQIKQAETALYLAQLQLDKTTIKAPVAGTIVAVYATVGGMVAMGAPVATVMSPENEIVIHVEEYRLAELAIGQPSRLLVDAYPDRQFDGAIIRIAPELDPATRTVAVTIRPVDEDGLLAPGMFTTVELLQ